MKCPQLLMFRPIDKSMESNYFGDCLKEECAWWSSEADACAVMITAGSLAGLVAIGDTMLEKMPKPTQCGR